MENQLSMTSYSRTVKTLDDASCATFFSTLANCLGAKDLMSSHQTQELRHFIKDGFLQQDSEKTLFIRLLEQENIFLMSLLLGRANLFTNFFRYRLKEAISNLANKAADIGTTLLKPYELVLSKPFKIFDLQNKECIKLVSFPSYLLEVTKKHYEISQNLTKTTDLWLNFSSSTQLSVSTNKDIAEACSFQNIETRPFEKVEGQACIELMDVYIRLLCTNLLEVCEQFHLNQVVFDERRLKFLLENIIQTDFTTTIKGSFAVDENILDLLELKRISLFEKFYALEKNFEEITEILSLTSFSSSQIMKEGPSKLWTKRLHSQLEFELSKTSAKASEVIKAVSIFKNYIKEHELSPKEILGGETQKLHPFLTTNWLEKVKPILEEELTVSLLSTKTDDKNLELEKIRKLRDDFQTLK